MVKKRKLRWYGHISRSSGMAKILQGTVKGARRRGRQKKRWEDNIKEWTGMGFEDSLRAAEDREGWKGIVAMSSKVPRWPSRLRDRDEMSLECDSIKLSQFVCTHFQIEKRVTDPNHWLIALRFTFYKQLIDQTLSLMKALISLNNYCSSQYLISIINFEKQNELLNYYFL